MEKTQLNCIADEDDDPVIPYLRCLDYRYIRFFYHPLLDEFVMNNSWKDPAWTNVNRLRQGIEGEYKEMRSLVFGKNVIDIEEKTTMQLFVDEVYFFLCTLSFLKIDFHSWEMIIGFSPILCVPDCQFGIMGSR